MKRVFRWSGLIGFIATVTIVGAFWLLVADTLVKHGIEYAGTEAVGAEVDLDDADVGIAPLQIRLTRLQVTDPTQPTQNMIEFRHAVASLDLWKLLMGQVGIDELSVDGLQFDTPRQRAGTVKSKDTASGSDGQLKEKATKALTEMGVELPSIETILEKEPLLVTSRSEDLQATYAEEQAKLEVLQVSLPDEKQRLQYQQRIKTLTESKPQTVEELNRTKQELDQLKREIREVKQSLSEAKGQVEESSQTLQSKLAQLKSAPGEDWRRLSSKYSLSQGGALNLSGLLFGDKVQTWSNKVLYWYDLARPYLGGSDVATENAVRPKRATGRYIRFPSHNPTPDFLIREARVEVALPFGDVMGQLWDVTDQPEILGRPATLKIDAENLKGAERLVVDGSFDHVKPEKAIDSLQFKLAALKLDNVKLVSRKNFPLELSHAVTNFNGRFTMRGDAIDADFSSHFSQASFTAEAQEGITGEIAKAVAAIDRFNIDGAISGTLGMPTISLSSDMDKRLNQQLQQRIKAKQTEFEQKLRTALEQQISGPQEENADRLKEIQSFQAHLQGQIDEYEKMLQTKITGVQDEAKSETENKAKEQLQKGLEGLKF